MVASNNNDDPFKELSKKKRYAFAFAYTAIAIGAISFLLEHVFIMFNIPKPDSLVALVIEIGIGVIIAVVIYKESDLQLQRTNNILTETKKQQDEISKLIGRIDKMQEEQNRLLKDRQSVYADSIRGWINEVLDIDDFMKEWYPKFQSAQFVQKNSIGNNLISEYRLHLQTRMPPFKPIDLVDIFGKEISMDWTRIVVMCMGDIALYETDTDEGIKYLIQQGILEIPQTATSTLSSQQIPQWVKNNAGWWADGQVSDDEFVKGIQYLISSGILQINTN